VTGTILSQLLINEMQFWIKTSLLYQHKKHLRVQLQDIPQRRNPTLKYQNLLSLK